MSNLDRLASPKNTYPHHKNKQYINLFTRSIVLLGLIAGGSPLGLSPALAAPTAPGVTINNQATGTFTDAEDPTAQEESIVSNVVSVTVAEVAGIAITANNTPGNVYPGQVTNFDFKVQNIGNDPTKFFLPTAPANVTGGTAGTLQIVAYIDATGNQVNLTTPIDINAANDTGAVSDPTLGGNTTVGSIPPDAAIVVRVPVTISPSATSVSVTLGNTADQPSNSNTPYIVGANGSGSNDVYTVDHLDPTTAVGETTGPPINSRQEASATITVAVASAGTNDFGDAPDSYGTDVTAGNSGSDPIGASHKVDGITYLGNIPPDVEANAVAPLDGTGDGAQDDGVIFSPLYAGNTNYSIPISNITVQTPGNATLHGWIDFNKNGKFEANEYSAVPIINGKLTKFMDWAGISPGTLTVGQTYARFRITTDSSINANTPGGAAINGEVEDYPINIQNLPPSPASGNLQCMDLSVVKRNASDYPHTYLLDPTGAATLPNRGVKVSLSGNNGTNIFGSWIPSNAAGKSFSYKGTTVALQGNGAYLDLVRGSTGVSRTLGLDFGVSANSLAQGNSTYEYVIGIAGLGGVTNPKEDGTITSNVLLTKVGDIDAFSTGSYASLDGVQNPPVGSSGTVVRTPPSSVSTGYTFYSIPSNVSGANFVINDINASTSPEQFGFVACAIEYVGAPQGAISGNVFNDLDGSRVKAVSGENYTAADITAVLLDITGKVVFTAPVSATGDYTFSKAPAGNYTVKIIQTPSTALISGVVIPPAKDVLPASWSATGENLNGVVDNAIDRTQSVIIVGSDITGVNFGIKSPVVNNPNVLLVKRITAINGSTVTNSGDNLAIYKEEEANPYDDNAIEPALAPTLGFPQADTTSWPDTTGKTSSTFLLGGINGGKIKPQDTIEYTIYFLSTGNVPAANTMFCDRVPSNITFVPNAFNNYVTPAPGGVSDNRGILALINGITASHTNLADGDAARYVPAGTIPKNAQGDPINCGGSNDNGAVIFNLGTIPNATAPATPAGSYGFVRFQGQVK